MTEALRALAPAKINLWLHVAPPDATGYHPLRSLIAFADIGDEVSFSPEAKRGFSLIIEGPFSQGLSNGSDNLILKAATAFSAVCPAAMGGQFRLFKNLPVAAGLGGGSSDAGAALRLLRQAFAPEMPDAQLEAIAAPLGADAAMCLWARPCIAEGYGERLTHVDLPMLPAVLINPGIECPTGAVYSAYDRNPRVSGLGQGLPNAKDTAALIELVADNTNDLAVPAISLKPEIGSLLTSLKQQPEAVLARMSGSGATCFALCRKTEEAQNLSDRLKGLWPESWVIACHLN